MTDERVVLVGATSGIGRALGRELARRGAALCLVGRDAEALEDDARDLRARYGARVATRTLEARDLDAHAAAVRDWSEAFEGGFTGVVACQGVLPEGEADERDPEALRRTVEVNFSSMVSILGPAGAELARRGGGFLCALSSVAGERGRARNALYGATKAALSTWLGGLRARLHARGVRVLTVKPGVVDTPMARGRAPAALMASPERVARDVVRALRRRRAVVYTPGVWRPVMAGIRLLPEAILRRLAL